MVIFKGVNFYPRQVEILLLRHPGVGHEYQIQLDADGAGERMSVVVETEPGCDPAVAARLRHELHDLLALSPGGPPLPVGTLERPQGKAVRVLDRRARAGERPHRAVRAAQRRRARRLAQSRQARLQPAAERAWRAASRARSIR